VAGYFDHNATTPLDERVLEAMLPYLKGSYANPSSIHRLGRLARSAIETAREQVATLVNVHPSQVIFTSGATEANNAAILGVGLRQPLGEMLYSVA
jgi:cysteine desulfurase